MIKLRAEKLLKEWRELEQSRACAFFLDLQASKYSINELADCLATEIYFSGNHQQIFETCNKFEAELIKYKNKAQLDLIAGLNNQK